MGNWSISAGRYWSLLLETLSSFSEVRQQIDGGRYSIWLPPFKTKIELSDGTGVVRALTQAQNRQTFE